MDRGDDDVLVKLGVEEGVELWFWVLVLVWILVLDVLVFFRRRGSRMCLPFFKSSSWSLKSRIFISQEFCVSGAGFFVFLVHSESDQLSNLMLWTAF